MQDVKSVNMPNLALRGDERSPSLPQLVSPARFLLELVYGEEREQGCARKQTLIDLAKYILGSRDWSPVHTEIIKVLARYHLAKLANIHPLHRSQSWKLIAAEEAKPYVARCMRCGLPIWNKTSLAAGHGPICRKKLGIKEKEIELPKNLEDLAKACKAPAKHKRMRRWHFGLDLGPKMTKEQLEELERLRREVKNNELTVNEARDIWKSKFEEAV